MGVPFGVEKFRLSAYHLAVQRGNPMLVAGRSRNMERLHACVDLLFEENVAVEVHEPEHAASLALDCNLVFVESVEGSVFLFPDGL